MIQPLHRFALLPVLLLVFVNAGLTQPQQQYRFELPARATDHDFDIISMGPEGLALIRDLNKYSQGKKKWQVELVDTTLTRFWSTELELENRLMLVGFEHVPGQLFLLYRETETTFNNFQLINLDLAQQKVTTDNVRFDLAFQLSHFTVSGTSALFGGYINSEPAVLLFNHSSDHPKVLPGLFAKNISLLDVRANQNQSFNVLLVENRRSEKNKLILRTFDPDGNLLMDDVIDIDSRFTILSGITSRLVQEEMMILGTYGEGSGNQALGIYSIVVDPFREQPVAYTDLASIDHFLDYLPEKKASRIRTKVSLDKSQGKTPNYKANLLPIRLEEFGGSFFLFAEVFNQASNVNYHPYSNPSANYNYSNPSAGYPYRSNRYDNPFYSEPTVRNAEVRMVQSVLLRYKTPTAFPEGLSMKYGDVKRPMLDQTGDFLIANDSAVLAYKKKNEIFYQHDSGDPMIRPNTAKASALLLNSKDIFRDETEDTSGGLRFWYANHLYIWGYRRVKTTVDEDVQSRYVFYVNRLDF